MNQNYLIIGKRETGKTTNIINNLLPTLDYDKLFVYTPADRQHYLNIDKAVVSNYYKPSFVKILKYIKNNPDEKKVYIFDDILRKIANAPVRRFFFSHHHHNTSIILTTQYLNPQSLTPNIRSNFDHIFIYRTDFISNRKIMFKYFGNLFLDIEEFNKAMNNLKEYEYLVVR
jgi:hypothetical protein